MEEQKDVRHIENKYQNADINCRSLPEKVPGPFKELQYGLAELPFHIGVSFLRQLFEGDVSHLYCLGGKYSGRSPVM